MKDFLRNKIYLLVIGLILGILLYLGFSIILSILISLSIFYFLGSIPQEEKNVLQRIIIIAFVLRFIFFIICMFGIYKVYYSNTAIPRYSLMDRLIGHLPQAFRDFDREIRNGIQIASYLRGEFGNIPIKEASYRGYGFLHAGAWTQGILHLLFGESIFNLLLFPIIDLWCIIIIYYLAKIVFDERTAIFSSSIYAIMPPTIVISCSNMRFSLSIFSLLLIVLFLIKFSLSNSFKYLIMVVIGIVLFSIFREKAALPLLAIIPLILLIILNIRFITKFIILLTFIFLFIILLNSSTFIQRKIVEILQNIVSSQVGFVTTAQGNIYKIYDEIVYTHDIKIIPPSILVKMLPRTLFKGIIYLMFTPFLWQIDNTLRLYAYPYVVFWYLTIPVAILGMIKSLFSKQKEKLLIILLCTYFVVLLSLVLGNEGIAIRYRELIAPFFYMFAGSMLYKFTIPKFN